MTPRANDQDPADDSVSAPFRRVARFGGAAAAIGLVLAGLWFKSGSTSDETPKAATSAPDPAASVRAARLAFVLHPTDLAGPDSAALHADNALRVELALVRTGDLGGFALLHPRRTGPLEYESAMPPVPAGTYHLFARLQPSQGAVRRIGRTISITGGMRRWRPTDRDDASYSGAGVGTPFRFDDGSTLSRLDADRAVTAGAATSLRFTLRDNAGKPRAITAADRFRARAHVVRNDGTEFSPLKEASTTLTDTIRFTHQFASAGRYRLWVELRVGARMRLAGFDLQVGAGQ